MYSVLLALVVLRDFGEGAEAKVVSKFTVAEALVILLAHRARTGLGARCLEGGGKCISDLVYYIHGHTPGWYIHTPKQ